MPNTEIPGGNGLTYAMMNGSHKGYATVEAPAWAMATAAWDVNDLLSLYATFRWANWSSFKELEITSDHPSVSSKITNNWRDTYLFSVGSDLRLTDFWTLRGGVGYETSPIKNPEYRTAIIPDANRWWFAVGSSFKWSEQFSTDVSFAHLHGVGERNLWAKNAHTGADEKGRPLPPPRRLPPRRSDAVPVLTLVRCGGDDRFVGTLITPNPHQG